MVAGKDEGHLLHDPEARPVAFLVTSQGNSGRRPRGGEIVAMDYPADNLVAPRWGSRRVGNRPSGIPGCPVLDPFGGVPVHVVESPRIGLVLGHRHDSPPVPSPKIIMHEANVFTGRAIREAH